MMFPVLPTPRKRGIARNFLHTVWTCPNCGDQRHEYRRPDSVGKILQNYCLPCRRSFFVELKPEHVFDIPQDCGSLPIAWWIG